MIGAYNSALAGLQASATKIQSNSNNIANASSIGFKRTRVTNASVAPSGVKPQVEKVTTPGTTVFEETENGMEMVELSNVDLTEELVDLRLNSTMYKANLKTIETVNEMTGALFSIKS